MKTFLALLLILVSIEAIAQKTNRFKPTKNRYKAHFSDSKSTTHFSQQSINCLFDFKKPERKQFKNNRDFKLGIQQRERSSVSKTLGRIYMKNGAAGLMGGWMNNVQFTFGWRYQPLRILTSDQPVPVHPFLMRVRVRL
jgi:hypothetical protein